MDATDLTSAVESNPSAPARATVLAVREDGSVRIEWADGATDVWCDVLETSDAARLTLEAGDAVVAIPAGPSAARGVILGRIGRAPTTLTPAIESSPDETDTESPIPDRLVLEATHSLTLRVGDGSITIRDDGRILIKGKDLVSHAQRVNRIKGGSVAIN